MKKFVIIAAATALAAPVLAQSPPRNVVSCDGPFARDSSFAKLQQTFGAVNVSVEEIDGAEGEKATVTALFAKDKSRRVEISWSDEAKRDKISQISIGRDSSWTSAGVRIGSSLTEVEALNGNGFTMFGFDWDYGGTVSDWHGGKFEKLPGGCRLGVRFEADEKAPAKARDKVVGDKDFSSSDPNMRASRPRVYDIFLGYPDEAAK